MARYKKPYSLHKRGKYWYYQTYDVNNIRTIAKSTGQTQKYAAIEYCENLLKGDRLLSSRLKFKEYAEHFFDDDGKYLSNRLTSVAYNSILGWRSRTKSHLIPELGEVELGDFTLQKVTEYRAYLYKQGYAFSNITAIFHTLRIILNTATNENLLKPIEWSRLERLQDTSVKRDGFTFEEVKNIIKNLPEDLRDFFVVLSCMGLRLSECYGLSQEDIKEKNGIHYVHLYRQLNHKVYSDLKTKETRDLPIPDELIPYIHPLGWAESYIYKAGNPCIRTSENWQERKLSLHSFRHFFITECKSKGIMPAKVEQYAGHSLKGIEAVYTKFHVEDFNEIIEWQTNTLHELQQIIKDNPTQDHGLEYQIKIDPA